MNKLYVYGDSYGNFNLSQKGSRKSWIDIVREKLNLIEVNNFAEPGLSPMHCYYNYMNHKHQPGYHVFVVPVLDRIYSPEVEKKFSALTINRAWYNTIGSIRRIEHHLLNRKNSAKNITDDKRKELLAIADALLMYFGFIHDMNSQNILMRMLTEKLVEGSNSNTVFVSVSKNVFPGISLYDISNWELEQICSDEDIQKFLDGEIIDHQILQDVRLNHLSDKNNIVLGDKIVETFTNKKKIVELNIRDFFAPTDSVDNYLKWMKV